MNDPSAGDPNVPPVPPPRKTVRNFTIAIIIGGLLLLGLGELGKTSSPPVSSSAGTDTQTASNVGAQPATEAQAPPNNSAPDQSGPCDPATLNADATKAASLLSQRGSNDVMMALSTEMNHESQCADTLDGNVVAKMQHTKEAGKRRCF